MNASSSKGLRAKDYANALSGIIAKKNFNRSQLANIIENIPPSILKDILQENPTLSALLEKEEAVMQKISASLQRNKFFSEKVEAINHTQTCSVLQQYIGLHYFEEWKKSPNNQANLDHACNQNLFDPLVARCKINAEKIKNNSDINNNAKAQLFSDIETLSNLYWLPGTVHGALILTDLASHYTNHQDEQAALGEPYYAAALELFFTAKELVNILHKDNASIGYKITRFIYEAIDLDALYQGINLQSVTGKFKDWGELQTFFLKELPTKATDTNFIAELANNAYKRTHPSH